MPDPVRAVVVGAGLMGRWHARELERAGSVVAAVVDPDETACSRLAKRHESAAAFADLGEALQLSSRPDVVHVCTPTASHVELVEGALAAGAHVLVEKPLAPDSPSTAELVAQAKEAGLLLCPVHQYLFQPGFLMAQRRARELGPWLQVDALTCSAGGLGREGAELDAIAGEVLPHQLAALERLLPAGLQEADWLAARLDRGELRAFGQAGRASLSLAVSMGGRPTRNELRLIGEGGTVELDFFHGYGFVERGRPSRARKALRPFAISAQRAASAATNLGARVGAWEPAYPGLRELIARFHAAVSAGGQPPIAFEESLAVAAARDSLLEAARARAGRG